MSNYKFIYTLNSLNVIQSHAATTPATENEIQRLIADYPQLIATDEDLQAVDNRVPPLLLVKREVGIPGTSGGSDRWSIDHVFVTPEGVPVLVEVKRAANTELRRQVVGQLMEYAANASTYWQPNSLREAYEERTEEIYEHGKSEIELFLAGRDIDDFWDLTEANLRSGNIRLVFVADSIPDELARIVEFMNSQMKAEVLAVELSHYRAANGSRTIVPRVVGHSEQFKGARASKRPSSALSLKRSSVYSKALETLERFKGANTSRHFLTSTPDGNSGEFVIFVKPNNRTEFEYIIRSPANDNQKRLLDTISSHCGIELNHQKLREIHQTHDPSEILDRFRSFESRILDAIQRHVG